MTVRKVQFETINRFQDVTEHCSFAVVLKRGHKIVDVKSVLGVAYMGIGRELDFCAHVPELAPEIASSLEFCMRQELREEKPNNGCSGLMRIPVIHFCV